MNLFVLLVKANINDTISLLFYKKTFWWIIEDEMQNNSLHSEHELQRKVILKRGGY